MALPPSPIDHVFANPETFKDSLINAKEFKLAIEKAKVAFLEAENAIEDSKKEGHILCGASPSQAARQAFLTTLSGQN